MLIQISQSPEQNLDQTLESDSLPNFVEEVIETSKKEISALEELKNSNDMLCEVFSYLEGCDIIHKIAVINQRFREVSQKLGALDYTSRIITLKVKKQ